MKNSINEYKALYGNKGLLTFVFAIKCRMIQPSFNALVLIREMHSCKSELKKIIIHNKLIKKYSIEISSKAKIGMRFRIEHMAGIVIGAGAVIGNDVTIYQNVTIGQKNGQYPQIMDNVTLYAGAKVLGNITVGENSVIGANAVVLSDIPANVVVAGIPARIVKGNNK